MTIWTKSYALALLERVIATFVMTFLSLSGLDGFVAGETGFDGIAWGEILLASAVAAGLSAVKGVVANLITKDGPSLSHAEQVEPSLPAPAAS